MKLEDVLKTNKFNDEVHKATLNILYTSYWMRDNVSSTMKEIGITSEQFNILRILKGKHPEAMCVKDIASRMIEKSSNVPRILDRLVAKELVMRTTSKEDKRETIISLTDTGIQTLQRANEALAAINKKTIGINNEEAAVLNQLLEKLRITD
ncbi:MAG: MarR family winged helix-turn-helix transcriptional regulator [Flavipsychrobacter sp.]|jgi:DNA-binding MarR family transcriptional regulator